MLNIANKNLFTLGFTGKCKRTNKLFVGRVQLLAENEAHSIARATKFYAKNFDNLEIYGAHVVREQAA